MTIDECVRALAEKMEPSRNIHEWTCLGYRQISKLGFWTRNDSGKVEPISPLDSAECSERLLEAMPEPWIEKDMDQWVCGADRKESIPIYSKNRRMAIFLAALKWRGIEEPK